MFEQGKNRKQLTKWILGVASNCILIYLCLRYIHVVADGVSWVFGLLRPLILGAVFALILNTPMRTIEKHLFPKKQKFRKIRRPLAIVLAILLILVILCGVILLVIPKFIDAIIILAQSIAQGIDRIMEMKASGELHQTPFSGVLQYLEQIDWEQLKNSAWEWAKGISGILADSVASIVGSLISGVTEFFIGLIFSIYILLQKERIKGQFGRLIRAWIPERFGSGLIHVFEVCSGTFQNFIAGQVTEAFILGSLCAIGMGILRLPYAPMVGALVGVTALIPIVGAFIGTIVGAFMILMVNPIQAVIFVAFLLILQQIEGNIIYPRVVGSKINLPAIWVFAAVTIGGNLAGPLGMLISVPAASAAYALLKEATELRERKMTDNSVESVE